jgi:flavin reductase (DIM6/NTAB) family NADH-FMN oxidoreductase RutF
MASGDFVINITSDTFADMIEHVAMESPPDVDEFDLAGWTAVEATKVSSPAIGEACGRLECVIRQVVELGEPGVPFGEVHLVIAEVVWVQYDASILDERGRIDPLALAPVGRLGLRSFLRTVPEGVLNLPRVPWDEHVAGTSGRSV